MLKSNTPFLILLAFIIVTISNACCELTGDCEENDGGTTTENVIEALFDQLPQQTNPSLSGFTLRERWQKANLTYYIDNTTPDMSSNAQPGIFKSAFDKWAAVTPLTFSQVSSPGQADIVIGFGAGTHCGLYSSAGTGCSAQAQFDGSYGTLAHCYFPGQGSISGDAHFDEDENWSENPGFNQISLPSVALHELGHGLGLDHSQDLSAVMYASYSGNDIKLNLRSDDIAGIQALYGESGGTPPPPPPPPSENPNVAACGTSTTLDLDGDGIDNATEYYIIGTNPEDCDTDDDGLPDSEVYHGLNPLVFDTDGDGVGDGAEIQNGTNPFVPDQGTGGGGGGGTIDGHYVGFDNYGGALDFILYPNGYAEGSLQFVYQGIPYFVSLVGGFDAFGQFSLVSFDYFWVYYGTFGVDVAGGNFETAGGAFGTWSCEKIGLQEPEKIVDRASLPNSDVYTPVPEDKVELQHPAHVRVDWKE